MPSNDCPRCADVQAKLELVLQRLDWIVLQLVPEDVDADEPARVDLDGNHEPQRAEPDRFGSL